MIVHSGSDHDQIIPSSNDQAVDKEAKNARLVRVDAYRDDDCHRDGMEEDWED